MCVDRRSLRNPHIIHPRHEIAVDCLNANCRRENRLIELRDVKGNIVIDQITIKIELERSARRIQLYSNNVPLVIEYWPSFGDIFILAPASIHNAAGEGGFAIEASKPALSLSRDVAKPGF